MENQTDPEKRAVSRLQYPAPPEVWVKVPSAAAAALDRLCSATGQSPGEVAAIFLAECLVLDPAQGTLRASAEKLRALYWERRRELQVQPPSTITAVDQTWSARHPASSIRVPLSIGMNVALYNLAVESGPTREQIAGALLQQANLTSIADQIDQAASSVVATATSIQTVS